VYNPPPHYLVYWFHYRTTLHRQCKLCISWFRQPVLPVLPNKTVQCLFHSVNTSLSCNCETGDRMEQALEYTRHTSARGQAWKPFGLLVDLFKFNSGSPPMSFHTLSTPVSALTTVRQSELTQLASLHTVLFYLHGSPPPPPILNYKYASLLRKFSDTQRNFLQSLQLRTLLSYGMWYYGIVIGTHRHFGGARRFLLQGTNCSKHWYL
jgi:hypothetical protein